MRTRGFLRLATVAAAVVALGCFVAGTRHSTANAAPAKSSMMGKMEHGGAGMMQSAASKKLQSAAMKIEKGPHYNCCIRPTCDWCAVHMGTCPCGPNAATGKPVCINCKGGWDAGQGAIPSKTTADIKVMSAKDMQMMMGHGKMMPHGHM